MATISITVPDAVSALAEEAAHKYGFASAAAWATDWLKNSLVGFRQQQHQAVANKAFEKAKRETEDLFPDNE